MQAPAFNSETFSHYPRHKECKWFPVECSLDAFRIEQDLTVNTEILTCRSDCHGFLACLSFSRQFSTILGNSSFS